MSMMFDLCMLYSRTQLVLPVLQGSSNPRSWVQQLFHVVTQRSAKVVWGVICYSHPARRFMRGTLNKLLQDPYWCPNLERSADTVGILRGSCKKAFLLIA